MRKKLKIDVLNYIKKGISQTESDVYTKIKVEDLELCCNLQLSYMNCMRIC